MIEARRLAQDADLDFAQLFRYQYVVSPRPLDLPGMKLHRLGDRFLYAGPSARVATLIDARGRPFGLVVGIAVDRAGMLSGERVMDGVDVDAPWPFDAVEDWLEHLAGRYTVLVNIGPEYRVYSDPIGMNGQVYNRETGLVASSPFLCLDRPLEPHPLYDLDEVAAGRSKISLFHTADRDVVRQNPNCALDLASFQEFRFWPREGRFRHRPEDHEPVYDEIIATVEHVVGAVTRHEHVALPLSGGRDSRLLLAMMGETARSRLQVAYSHVTNYATRRDAVIAGRVADALGVQFRIFSLRDTPQFDRRRKNVVRRLAGHAIASGRSAGLRDPQFRLERFVPERTVVMRGHQTDLLRAVFVSHADPARWKNLARHIRKLYIVPAAEFSDETFRTYEPHYRAWLQGLPPAAVEKQLDFMFLEIYYASTLGALFPALPEHFYMSPFNSRRLIALSLGFDDAFRLQHGPVHDLIHRAAPALDAIPYDDETGPSLDELEDREAVTAPMQERIEAVRERVEAAAEMAEVVAFPRRGATRQRTQARSRRG